MSDCPICERPINPAEAVEYLGELYCSPECAERAAEEGRDQLPAAEVEEAES